MLDVELPCQALCFPIFFISPQFTEYPFIEYNLPDILFLEFNYIVFVLFQGSLHCLNGILGRLVFLLQFSPLNFFCSWFELQFCDLLGLFPCIHLIFILLNFPLFNHLAFEFLNLSLLKVCLLPLLFHFFSYFLKFFQLSLVSLIRLLRLPTLLFNLSFDLLFFRPSFLKSQSNNSFFFLIFYFILLYFQKVLALP